MSHHSLQKALVVALHDGEFVARMHSEPDQALADFDLSLDERRQLLAIDRRALSIDRMRSRRVLKAISAELPASLTIALAHTRRFATAEGFFASARFRRAIIDETSLVFALADYLSDRASELGHELLDGVVAIERARARCRRPEPGRSGLRLADGVALIETTAGTLAALHAAESALFEASLVAHMALCDDSPSLSFDHLIDETAVFLVVAARAGDVILEPVDEPLYAVLSAVEQASQRGPIAPSAMAGLLADIGLRVPDPDQLTRELCASGYLRD